MFRELKGVLVARAEERGRAVAEEVRELMGAGWVRQSWERCLGLSGQTGNTGGLGRERRDLLYCFKSPT